MKHKGFTIIEVLVVITIIGILAAMVIISYGKIQMDARDTQRSNAVTAITTALERYYDKNGEYPANDNLNPTAAYPQMTDFTAMKTLLPTLSDDILKGPGGYSFFPGCINSASCPNSSNDWKLYMSKEFFYSSRYATSGAGTYFTFSVPASYGGNLGWGCSVKTYYDKPGFMIAWYSESKKIWIFVRSKHGQIDIANYSTGPVAPQTCTFS